jgi:hypothetical protein
MESPRLSGCPLAQARAQSFSAQNTARVLKLIRGLALDRGVKQRGEIERVSENQRWERGRTDLGTASSMLRRADAALNIQLVYDACSHDFRALSHRLRHVHILRTVACWPSRWLNKPRGKLSVKK